MIEEIDVLDWSGFEKLVEKIKDESERIYSDQSKLLFRGQGSSIWDLETTLERFQHPTDTVRNYFSTVNLMRPMIDSLTGHRWETASNEKILQITSDFPSFDREIREQDMPSYDYLAYLRHHGFPSPLLDWTRSPYVAGFFAFRQSVGDHVSIFILLECFFGLKARSRKGSIYRLGQHVRTHKRHFLQQSDYSIALSYDDDWHFLPHSRAVGPDIRHDDHIWKVNLPSAIANDVLSKLDQMNINAFSLLGSEESLMETLATRVYTLKTMDFDELPSSSQIDD